MQKEKPDLIHLHIFQHQISPSILDIAKKYDIPTVYTAHDLKMVCLNYKMMHHGTICEECRGGKYYRCARNRCVKDSLLKSTINVAEGYLHKWKKSYDVIDRIITPSVFYKEKFRSFGVDENRLVHIPNFLNREIPLVNSLPDSKEYYLYFGRLSEEKGILTLIKAFEQIQQKLVIVGTGPLKEQLTQYVKDNKIDNVTFKGFLSGQDLTDVVGTAKAVILPSEWYENGPYSAIEALQLGRPIIGADIGGIPELVDGNGLLFRSGDAADLKDTIRRFEALSPEGYAGMEEASSSLFQKQYTKEVHYERLMQVYQAALIKKQIVEKKA